jgi:hypothetical protein
MEAWGVGRSVMTFLGIGDGPATSIAHALIELWLSRTLRPDNDPSASYELVATLLGPRRLWDPQMQRQAARLVPSTLRSDTARMPAASIISYLNAALDLAGDDDQIRTLILECALTATSATQDPYRQDQLAQIARKCGQPL